MDICAAASYLSPLAFVRFYKLHVTSLRFAQAVRLHWCVRRLAAGVWDKNVRLYGSLYIPYWDIKAMKENRGYECNLWSCFSIVDKNAGFLLLCRWRKHSRWCMISCHVIWHVTRPFTQTARWHFKYNVQILTGIQPVLLGQTGQLMWSFKTEAYVASRFVVNVVVKEQTPLRP